MRAEVGARPAGRSRPSRVERRRARLVRRRRVRIAGGAVAFAVAATAGVGVVFAGSPDRIAEGVTIGGIDVGGLTAEEARGRLAERAARLASVPATFVAGEKRWRVAPRQLDLRVDWAAVAAEAVARGGGPIPFRGLKRLRLRVIGTDVAPQAHVYEPGVRERVRRIAAEIHERPREAAIVLRGLAPRIVPAQAGSDLDTAAAGRIIVSALTGFERGSVPLPVRVEAPKVTAKDLAPAAAQVRTALSAPVRLGYKDLHWSLEPARLAPMLELPANGSTKLGVGGPSAEGYFANFARGIARKAQNAGFRVLPSGRVRVVPAIAGRALDVEATSDGVLAAALLPARRQAELVVVEVGPKVSTEKAKTLGIRRVLSSYTTLYAGSYDRIRNLQLAVTALDGTLIAPGETFSFNEVVGPRTTQRGYRPAPVIMNGEYADGVGGGVSQVATTVFNVAWEAGLKITQRTAHALYISRYPLGRDATVNYPDIDLKFRNDTGRWIFMQARYGDSGIAVSLLGGGSTRRVVSQAGELEQIAPPSVKRVPDPNLFAGERVIEDWGEPARAVTVTRVVYVGKRVLYRETWNTTYGSEPRIVRVGSLPKPVEEKPKSKPKSKAKSTTTGTTTTGTTTGGRN